MSYSHGEIKNYLSVAKGSRTGKTDSVTPQGRIRMGRKGIGKLAALSVSSDVYVMTIRDGEKSGFVLTRYPKEGGVLEPISDNKIKIIYYG